MLCNVVCVFNMCMFVLVKKFDDSYWFSCDGV